MGARNRTGTSGCQVRSRGKPRPLAASAHVLSMVTELAASVRPAVPGGSLPAPLQPRRMR
jgi:hypothetical protein